MTRLCAAALLASSLFAQELGEVRIDQLANDFLFTEGPAWSKEGYLIFSDTPSDRLMKWVPGAPAQVFRADANGPSGNAFDAEGRLYTCETRSRRVTRTDKKGNVEVLAERWEGKRLNAPNDIVVGRNANVYFTDPAFGAQADHRELDFYGVYHIPPKGPIKLVAKPAGRPNGIALAPGGRTLYVVNSDERNVRAYDVDRNGETANERVVIAKIAGIPGGIRTDEKGNLYVTAGKAVQVYTSEGKPVRAIELGERASNCGFGETDLQTLFITAGKLVYRARIELKGAY
jgi:gluconolactonase